MDHQVTCTIVISDESSKLRQITDNKIIRDVIPETRFGDTQDLSWFHTVQKFSGCTCMHENLDLKRFWACPHL